MTVKHQYIWKIKKSVISKPGKVMGINKILKNEILVIFIMNNFLFVLSTKTLFVSKTL